MSSGLLEQIAFGATGRRPAQSLANAASLALSAAAAFGIAISASFYSTVTSIHLAAILVALLFVQVQLQPRIFFCREFSFYVLFVAYMIMQVMWTENAFLEFNTLVPAVNFVVIVALFGSLIAFHNLRSVLVKKLERGTTRIALGIEILQTRESIPGYGGFESRSRWFLEGFTGWARNPVFGHGVEAFRHRFGMTSHSTPIDVLYNSGLIGFSLFYSMFASVFGDYAKWARRAMFRFAQSYSVA